MPTALRGHVLGFAAEYCSLKPSSQDAGGICCDERPSQDVSTLQRAGPCPFADIFLFLSASVSFEGPKPWLGAPTGRNAIAQGGKRSASPGKAEAPKRLIQSPIGAQQVFARERSSMRVLALSRVSPFQGSEVRWSSVTRCFARLRTGLSRQSPSGPKNKRRCREIEITSSWSSAAEQEQPGSGLLRLDQSSLPRTLQG
jgi:hypothetical protein